MDSSTTGLAMVGRDILHMSARWRSLWRLAIAWRFRLLQQHRHRKLVVEHVCGMPLVVLPEVFNPKLFHTSEALAGRLEQLGVGPETTVLDMGTGSGIGAIAAARLGARVVAVDISPDAVRCATINALLNRVDALVEVRCGDLFDPVGGERFDLVLFNPPFYAGVPQAPWEYAWRSMGTLQRFALSLGDVLTPAGRAVVVVSSETVGVQEAVAQSHLRSRVLWQRDMVNERLMVLEWTLGTEDQ